MAFDHVKIEGMGDCEYAKQQRELIREHMSRTGGKYSSHEHGGNCMVCGNANAIYTALFYHPETNVYVRVGQDCAEKMEFSSGDWNAFRTAIKDARELHAGKRKAEAILKDEGLTAAWDLYNATEPRCHCDWSKPDANGTQPWNTGFIYPNHPCTCERWGGEELTIRDIVGKLVRYGSISDAQIGLIRIKLKWIENRAAIAAQRAAEKAAAKDCPTGRVTVTGTVLTTKWQENDFGGCTKMMLKTTDGYTVWSSLPSIPAKYLDNLPEGWDGVKRGMTMKIKVTLEPSKNDPKHGFGSRPAYVEFPPIPAQVQTQEVGPATPPQQEHTTDLSQGIGR